MSGQTLHIFAVNAEDRTRHTHLSRAKGESPDLPPLADWLGVEAVNTDLIELFPVEVLEDTALADYVTLAFDPDPAPDAGTRARLDALEGSVLLVPGGALGGDPAPGAELTHVATLQLAGADHVADLPKADLSPRPQVPDPPAADPEAPRRLVSPTVTVAVVIAVFLLVYLVFVG